MVELHVASRCFPNFVVMREANTAALHHDRRGAVLLCTQVDCAFNFRRVEFVARDYELDVDVGKHFRLFIRTQRRDLNAAVRYVLTSLSKDVHDVKRCTTPEPYEYELHRSSTNVVSAVFGWSIHLEGVARFGGGRKSHIAVPLNQRFHTRPAQISTIFRVFRSDCDRSWVTATYEYTSFRIAQPTPCVR